MVSKIRYCNKMKQVFILLTVVFSLVIVDELIAEQKTIVLGSTEWPPFYGKNLKNGGFITEIVIEAFAKSGYKVKILFAPWKRVFVGTKRGDYDGLFTVWYRKDREKWFVYSKVLSKNEVGFYKRNDRNITFDSLTDLQPYKVGVVRGYATPPGFSDARLQIHEGIKDENLFKMLYKGRIDLMLTDKIVGRYIINTTIPNASTSLGWLEPSLKIDTQHLVISKKVNDCKKIMTGFNQGLSEITEEGRVKEIMSKHGF